MRNRNVDNNIASRLITLKLIFGRVIPMSRRTSSILVRLSAFGWPALGLLAAMVSTCSSAFASPWAEVGDNRLRSEVELLQATGEIDDITTQWPLPWQSLQRDLRKADLQNQSGLELVTIQQLSNRSRAATAFGGSSWASLDVTNSPGLVYGFDGLGRGQGQAQLSIEATDGAFSGRISLGIISQNFRANRTKLMPDGSYGTIRLGGARLYLGYLDHWWGPGQISALSLSNDARPMPQIGIERANTNASSWPVLRWLGPWQFEFLLGYLDGPRIQPNSYYNAARFAIHPFSGFEIAVARTEEFCGQDHPCSPLKDYFHFSNNPDSVNNTNDEANWDFKYSHTLGGIPFQVYLQLMNEDYSWFNHSGTSHLFGASVFLPAPDNPVKLTVEFADSISTHHPFSFGDNIYGFSYTNGTFIDGMRYRGRTLGFSLDDDSTLLSLQANWSDAGGSFYELTLHHATIGNSHSIGDNILSISPVVVNVAEARFALPVIFGRWRLELRGQIQDDQPRPHKGFSAAMETALKLPL